MTTRIERLQELVRTAAQEELLPRFTHVGHDYKADGSLITEADLAIQKRLAMQLAESWPEIGFLGEEMSEAEQTALLESGQPLWCLDPLDGTRNFAGGIPYFSVSLALLEEGGVSLGIVYDPIRDECFAAENGKGATLNGKPLSVPESGVSLEQCTSLIDLKRLPKPLAARLATEAPYASQRSFGSVALDWCWLACGRCQIYLHGKQNVWDYAAGNLIFLEAGGFSSTLEGESVFVNALIPRTALGAGEAQMFRDWTEWLGVEVKT
jgi:myo-inositol-1(or 4)-monophosphatase